MSLFCIATTAFERQGNRGKHQDVGEQVASDIPFNTELRGQGAENRLDLEGNWFIFLFHHKGDERGIKWGIHSRRCLRQPPQGNPVAFAGKLEIRGTQVETGSFKITEGNIEEGRQKGKARIQNNVGGIWGPRVILYDQYDVSLIANQILESQKSRLGQAVHGCVPHAKVRTVVVLPVFRS